MEIKFLPDGSYHLGEIILTPDMIDWINWIQTGGTMGDADKVFNNSGNKNYKRYMTKIITTIAKSVRRENLREKDAHLMIDMAAEVLMLFEQMDLPKEIIEQVNKKEVNA